MASKKALFSMMLVFYISASFADLDPKEEAKRRFTKAVETEVILKAKTQVANSMKDPSSVKFKDVFFNNTEQGGEVACGLVNAKNSLGAYSGFQGFIANGKTMFLEEKDPNFSDVWSVVCVKR